MRKKKKKGRRKSGSEGGGEEANRREPRIIRILDEVEKSIDYLSSEIKEVKLVRTKFKML